MGDLESAIHEMEAHPNNVRFGMLKQVCNTLFGPPRNQGTSHLVYKTPWQGDPRINIQDDHGRAKAYQVRQVLAAIKRLEGKHGDVQR